MSRRKLDEDQIRVQIWGRVDPATRDFLDTLPGDNMGRKIDYLVEAYAKLYDQAFAKKRKAGRGVRSSS